MIYTKLDGGLGNQFFQLLAAFHFSKHDSSKICVLENNCNTSVVRSLFQDLKFVSNEACPNFANFVINDSFLNKIRKSLLKKIPPSISKYIYWNEGVNYNLADLDINDVILDGYWQDLSLISGCIEVLKERVLAYKFSENFYEVKNLMMERECINVHVRRGDYLNSQFKNKFDVCGVSYYLDAIGRATNMVGNSPTINIFTNDQEWCFDNLGNKFENVNVISARGYLTDFEEMILIGLAKCVVIPNSTFSWWGAVLSEQAENVICPKSWFNGYDRKSLIKNNWIRI
ncbi:TPA: hypothetical protein I7148_20500 [Vibrio vulnificus]|nr:hypothetical protein [Vibrio vulnificus]